MREVLQDFWKQEQLRMFILKQLLKQDSVVQVVLLVKSQELDQAVFQGLGLKVPQLQVLMFRVVLSVQVEVEVQVKRYNWLIV